MKKVVLILEVPDDVADEIGNNLLWHAKLALKDCYPTLRIAALGTINEDRTVTPPTHVQAGM